ncbi:MAG: hypothetical protein ACXVFN_21630, partial [Solirubrobacteraceae bacterium]
MARSLGSALRAAGLVTGGTAGLALLAEAVEVLASSPSLLERLRALVELGAAQRRAGRRAEARATLTAATDLGASLTATA